MLAPSMIRAQALASGTAVAFGDERHRPTGARVGLQHVEHVVLERVLHVEQAHHPDAVGDGLGGLRTASISPLRPRVTGGSAQAESPEWMPASSMCSMTPPMYTSVPSHRASTSISMASSRNRSTSTGCSGESWVARVM